MTNNIKAAREALGIGQRELATIMQEIEPRIDVGMISRFENGVCLPTPIVADRLASALGVSSRDLFSEEGQTYLQNVRDADEPVEGLPFVLEDLMHELSNTPRTRRELREALDISDRLLRKRIAEARELGYAIVNQGDGYFIPEDLSDMKQFYFTERKRALSILRGLKRLRNYLKKMGVNLHE